MIFESVCFTGHRPQDLGGFDEKNIENVWVKTALAKCIRGFISHFQTTEWISGGALGVDQWAAEIVLWLKENERPDLKLIIMKPFTSQHAKWNERSQNRFLQICDYADEVIICQPDPYAAWKMQYRNKEMVNRAKAVLSVWKGSDGGTGNCVAYANAKKRPIYRIDPITKKTFWERNPE